MSATALSFMAIGLILIVILVVVSLDYKKKKEVAVDYPIPEPEHQETPDQRKQRLIETALDDQLLLGLINCRDYSGNGFITYNLESCMAMEFELLYRLDGVVPLFKKRKIESYFRDPENFILEES